MKTGGDQGGAKRRIICSYEKPPKSFFASGHFDFDSIHLESADLTLGTESNSLQLEKQKQHHIYLSIIDRFRHQRPDAVSLRVVVSGLPVY